MLICAFILFHSVCAFVSFITVTFVVEALSLANILLHRNKSQRNKKDGQTEEKYSNSNIDIGRSRPRGDFTQLKQHVGDESTYLTDTTIEDIGRTRGIRSESVSVELGEMSKLFFNRFGVIFYYASICLYIYGTTTVYLVVICKSLTSLLCDDMEYFARNSSSTNHCRPFTDVEPTTMYRYALLVLSACVCPFAYFEMKKTRFLQLFATGYRWFAIMSMATLTFVKIWNGDGIPKRLNLFAPDKLPGFLGIAMYAFMCHHTIPAVTSPVTNQNRVSHLLGLDFLAVLTFYTVTLMSSVFAFPEQSIQDVYTMNFQRPIFFKYLLQLFPLLTLSTTIPVFAIVLRKNLLNIFSNSHTGRWSRFVFSSVSILPPVLVALLTHNVSGLVMYTGTYAGAIIQYVVPTLLVWFGRREVARIYGELVVRGNPRASPFGSSFWVGFLLLWYVASVFVVTFDNIRHI